jgi:hypothetical protein
VGVDVTLAALGIGGVLKTSGQIIGAKIMKYAAHKAQIGAMKPGILSMRFKVHICYELAKYPDAKDMMYSKLKAVRMLKVKLPKFSNDGRVRHYRAEKLSATEGQIRESPYVAQMIHL